jgi:hypothetical protein
MGWVHRLLACAAAVAASGCELVFPLGPSGRPDAPPIADGTPPPPDDGEPPPPMDGFAPCPGSGPNVAVLPAEADAMISSSSPGTPLGAAGVVNIGVDIQSRGLFRFGIPPEVVTPLELRLVLLYAANQTDCGGNCASCAPIERTGTLQLHPATSLWNEGTVTWNQRAVGVAWAGPGASSEGPPELADHSTLSVAVAHEAVQDTTFVLAGPALTDAWQWLGPPLATRPLSFLIIPVEPAVMVATSREGAANPCAPADAPAQLVVTYCGP